MLTRWVAIALIGLLPACSALAMECPPPGYDGNQDCGYECGVGGTCCGNPRYYGSYVFGTWRPDPRCPAVGKPPSTPSAPPSALPR